MAKRGTKKTIVRRKIASESPGAGDKFPRHSVAPLCASLAQLTIKTLGKSAQRLTLPNSLVWVLMAPFA